MTPSPLTLLDACAVVSLFASRRMVDVLRTIPPPIAIVDVVEREVQYVRRGGDGDDAHEREQVDLAPLISAGALSVLAPASDAELQAFVDLTLVLDDGEAMTAALAVHRGAVVVTDDRKAERELAARSVPIRSTLDVIKTWVEQEGLDGAQQRTVLLDVRQRGRYEPARRHPLRPWWDAVLGG